jgi:hypothetical protein
MDISIVGDLSRADSGAVNDEGMLTNQPIKRRERALFNASL